MVWMQRSRDSGSCKANRAGGVGGVVAVNQTEQDHRQLVRNSGPSLVQSGPVNQATKQLTEGFQDAQYCA